MEDDQETIGIDIYLEDFPEEKFIEFLKRFNQFLREDDPENEKYEIKIILSGNMNTPTLQPEVEIAVTIFVLSEGIIDPLKEKIKEILEKVGIVLQFDIRYSAGLIPVY
ncbi:hypothetical protein KAJ89_03085 [Candidatus Parcubacteria bacterium]|nr:hypothetical protein [Candidatus Parcubacteria bacterium]